MLLHSGEFTVLIPESWSICQSLLPWMLLRDQSLLAQDTTGACCLLQQHCDDRHQRALYDGELTSDYTT